MSPTDLVNLAPLMQGTCGRPEIAIGLIDGPVVITHPDLAARNIREVPGNELPAQLACTAHSSLAFCRQRRGLLAVITKMQPYFDSWRLIP